MIDFNDAAPQGKPSVDWIDQEDLSDALADTADQWVPKLFPRGRRDTDGNWRLANIMGDAPRKSGSCVIAMHGDRAGSWIDFSGGPNAHGGPLSTIKENTGLSGAELFAYARELVGNYIRKPRQRIPVVKDDHRSEVDHILKHCERPIANTLAGAYFRARGIDPPPDGDLGFNGNCTHWQSRSGQPALIALFTYPDGQPTGGIHRVYLKEDGSWHNGKKMLGPTAEGVIRMGQIDNPEFVGVGEGIESTGAGMKIFKVPCGWAAASAGGMSKLADWLREHGPGPVKRMLIFVDRGKAGMRGGEDLLAAAKAIGIEAAMAHPKGSDDLADDLAKRVSGHEHPFHLNGTAALAYPSLDQVNAILVAMPQFDAVALAEAMKTVADRCIGMEQEGQSHAAYVSQLFSYLKREKGFPLDVLKEEFKVARANALRLNRVALDELEEIPDWRAKAFRNLDMTLRPVLYNVMLALKYELDWRRDNGTNIVAMNEFTGFISLCGLAPWERKKSAALLGTMKPWRAWTDADDLEAAAWIQGPGRDIPAGREVVFQGVSMIANENSFHPVRDFLNGLPPWDGRSRLRVLLHSYAGCQPTLINELFGTKFCIGAVARVMRPGCQMDTAIILEGTQGIGKSTFFRILFGDEFFTDQISEFGTKDAALEMRGKWVIELAELDAMGKAETSRIKRFIGQTHDRVRPPYGRQVVECPRQNVFCGTTNENEYLRDPTGARRFWPAEATTLALQRLRDDREQIWAEALYRFRDGESWWLDKEGDVGLAHEEQSLRYQTDAWESVMESHLKGSLSSLRVTIPDMLFHALGLTDKAKWDTQSQRRVGAALRRLGYVLGGRETSGNRDRFYVKKSERQQHSDNQAAAVTIPTEPTQSYIDHVSRDREPGEDDE